MKQETHVFLNQLIPIKFVEDKNTGDIIGLIISVGQCA